YSQAVYTSEEETLEQAAQRKLDYVIEACRLRSGSRVLDVGGGWGSFAGYAGSRGVDVTMLTISREQFAFLSEWCATHTFPRASPWCTRASSPTRRGCDTTRWCCAG